MSIEEVIGVPLGIMKARGDNKEKETIEISVDPAVVAV